MIGDGPLRTFFDKISRNLMAPIVRGRPWAYNISDGVLTGKTPLVLFGRDGSGTATYSPIWSGSSAGYPYPTADQQIRVKSSDADDDNGDTGANTIRIWWLNSANTEATLDVTMDGTTFVDTAVVTMRRINRMQVLTCGATGGAEGVISVYATDGATLLAQMNKYEFTVGDGVSNGCLRTVPAGKRDVITRVINLSASLENRAPFLLRYRTSPTSPWLSHSWASPQASTDGPGKGVIFETPLVIAAGTDYGLWGSGTATAPREGVILGWTETV